MSNENNINNELSGETEVIKTIITNVSSETKRFNQSLRRELNNIIDVDIHAEDIDLILEYKPTNEIDLFKIPNLSGEVKVGYEKQIVKVVSNMVSQFVREYPNLHVINTDTRLAMKNVLLRNIHVSEKNELLDIDKMDNILSNNKSMNANLGEFVDGIFDGTTQEISSLYFEMTNDIETLKKYEKWSYTLEKSISINRKIFEEQNEHISLRGKSNLYISAFELKGKIENQKRKLGIKAPLIFIPIVILDNGDNYSVYFDDNRKIEMNEDVIVAYNTLHKKNTIINRNSFNKILNNHISIDDALEEIKQLYISNGLDIEDKIGKNVFTISNSISLGNMKVLKSLMHFDLNEILENGFITDNIIQMFSTKDPNFKQTVINGSVDEEVEQKINDLKSEGKYEVSTITKLNYPQEQAIKNLNVYDNIIIQGPPGTGKTETIVSIISDSILRNKKILVSSEKKVALEVIYSRLQELAKYSILLTDIRDTSKFYDQLEFMLEYGINDKLNQSNSSLLMSDNEIMFRRNETRTNIVDFIKTYEEIFVYLRTNEIGKTYSYLYQNHAMHRTTISKIKNILDESNLINIIKSNKLLSPRLYDVLYMLNEKFSYKKENTEFDLDKAVIASYPFLITHTKKYITTNRVSKVIQQIQDTPEDMLFSEKGFTAKTKTILRKIFRNSEHLFSYIQTKEEIINVVNIVHKKIRQVEMKVDESDPYQIIESLGSAWMLIFDKIIDFMESKGKIINPKLISALIFDHTIKQILLFKESTNPKLQQNISNGNIGTFNKMISKHLTEIIEFNSTLTERKLRDSLLKVMSNSSKMTEIQSFIENNKHANINKFFSENWEEVFKGVNVWLLPAEEVPTLFPLEPEMFDVVVIDEASQMVVEKALPLMYRAKQLVISGDSKQLKPSVNTDNRIFYDNQTSEINNAIMPSTGLQDTLKNKFHYNLINYHYRSSFAELINFSNAFIYKNSLYVSTPKTYVSSNPPIEWLKVKKARNVNGRNVVEAKKVVKRLVALIKEDPNQTIGIIAFSIKQKEELKNAIEKEAEINEKLDLFIRTNAFNDGGEDTSLFIKNVSEVQGDERDTIIFSIAFAASSSGEMPKKLGEISKQHGENRLNVAITRAKKKNIIITSLEPGDLNLPLEDVGGNLLKHFLYYAQAVASGKDRVVRRILKQKDTGEAKSFESPMHEEIYKLLKKANYNVEYSFGFDDYKMDFVIRDPETNEVVLGINLDNKQYLRNFNTLEREYYLPTYLEARGWNIMRIWSHQWSKDPEIENKKILKTAEQEIRNAKDKNNIISLFDLGETILDMSQDDPDFVEESQAIDTIVETENMFESAKIALNEVKRELKSNKRLAEEDKWLREYRALETLKGNKALETDQLIERDFLVDPKTKRIDGIEDSDIDDIIKLSVEGDE